MSPGPVANIPHTVQLGGHERLFLYFILFGKHSGVGVGMRVKDLQSWIETLQRLSYQVISLYNTARVLQYRRLMKFGPKAMEIHTPETIHNLRFFIFET